MKSTYGKEVYKNARSYAVWLPGAPVTLGDYGLLKENCFERLGSIGDLLPGFMPVEAEAQLDSFGFLSKGLAELRGKVNGKLMKVTYSASVNSGVVLYAKALTIRSISNLPALSEGLSTLEKWDRAWQVVTGVTTAKNFYALVGGPAGSKFSVTAEADVFPLLHLPLTSASAGFHVEGQCTLNLAGKSGAIMVNLHRMKTFGTGLKFAAPAEETPTRPTLVPCVEEPSEE